jgi:Protein of unknown function (DUF3800)
MAEKYVFADEAGCFTFSRGPNISMYFIICTVTMSELSVGQALAELRRILVWEKQPVGDYFHATSDAQVVRDRVYEVIVRHNIKIQVTICEKAKADPSLTTNKSRFYKYPWFYTFKHGIAPFIKEGDDVLVTAASIGTKKEKLAFTNELEDVLTQTVRVGRWAVDFRPSQCDPCLQVADYCAWAIQRKWERGDTRSYDLIKHLVTREYDLWSRGTKLHY